MIVIFLGRTGIYCEYAASFIYMGYEDDKAARMAAFYGSKSKLFLHVPVYIGKDHKDNLIYTLGVGKEVDMAKKTIEQLVQILGFSKKDLLVKKISGKGEWILELIGRFWPDSFLKRQLIYFLVLANMKNIKKQIID